MSLEETDYMSEENLELLYNEEEVKAMIKKLGVRIAHRVKEILKQDRSAQIVFVWILDGATWFFVHIIDEVKKHLSQKTLKNIRVESVSILSYDKDKPGKIRLLKAPKSSLNNCHVFMFEDIIDTGHTIKYLTNMGILRNLLSLEICALMDKPARREVEVDVAYTGITLKKDDFVVGSFLDFEEKGRLLPGIYKLKKRPA